MSGIMRILSAVGLLTLVAGCSLALADPPRESPASSGSVDSDYVLGPDDQIKIWALGVEEIPDRPFRIGSDGGVDLPVVGRVEAKGLTVEQFRVELLKRLEHQVWKPQVSVEVVEFGSQPVTVLGAVVKPGTVQLQGRKNLAELLSLAGGTRPDAGYDVRISREKRYGAIPLDSAHWAWDGDYSVADVNLKSLLAGDNPACNIAIKPHDVITVPTAETAYVIGAVVKPGTIVLAERQTISVLQALAMANGLGKNAKPQNAKILRTAPGSSQRTELPIDLKRIMEGRGEDVSLKANDVLLVPENVAQKAVFRTLEAMIQMATGVVIFRP